MQHYIYDAVGERILKANTRVEDIYENGQLIDSGVNIDSYTMYPSGYLVYNNDNKYTKHYYMGSSRIATQIGAGNILTNQTKKSDSIKELQNLQKLDLNIMLSKSDKPRTITFNKRKPIDFDKDTIKGISPITGVYFYHSDHLSTASLLTDMSGLPYQFFLNLPFGEEMASQHSTASNFNSRYKFNGKELDNEIEGRDSRIPLKSNKNRNEQTGWYYYGARYYDPNVSIWLSVDPLAEKFPAFNPYNFTMNNPVNLVDPLGLSPESIHLDKYGNVLKNVDDGDDGVYVHQNATSEADVDKTYSAKNTSAGGDKIGEIGGTLNVDGIYANTLNKNIGEAKDVYNPFTFKNYVKTNGKWDLKNNKNTIYGLANDGKTQFSFNGKLMESQDIGNHHFGAVALAYGLFPSEKFILEQAGAYQIKSGTSKPEWQIYKEETRYNYSKLGTPIPYKVKVMQPPYSDDPRDQKWIKSGFQYFKNK